MKKVLATILITVLLVTVAHDAAFCLIKSWQMDKEGRHEMNFELDPYYSNIAYIYALTSRPIPKVHLAEEKGMYWHMLSNFYLPRYMLLEASVYPLPIAGVIVKEYARDFYNGTQVTENLNLTRALTAGFPEPYAGSFFLGNVIDFVTGEGDQQKIVGNGYAGFLYSYGNYHIADNILIWDHWMEYEAKIKGSDTRDQHCLSWSYAIGTKFHFNKEIKDQLYLNIKRSRIDYVDENINPVWKFFSRNSEQELRLDFDIRNIHRGKIIRFFFLMGKNFPLFSNRLTLSLSAGLMRTVNDAYSGSLATKIPSRWDVLFRPNFQIKWD